MFAREVAFSGADIRVLKPCFQFYNSNPTRRVARDESGSQYWSKLIFFDQICNFKTTVDTGSRSFKVPIKIPEFNFFKQFHLA